MIELSAKLTKVTIWVEKILKSKLKETMILFYTKKRLKIQ